MKPTRSPSSGDGPTGPGVDGRWLHADGLRAGPLERTWARTCSLRGRDGALTKGRAQHEQFRIGTGERVCASRRVVRILLELLLEVFEEALGLPIGLRWRGPESNWGHHDFQSVTACEVRASAVSHGQDFPANLPNVPRRLPRHSPRMRAGVCPWCVRGVAPRARGRNRSAALAGLPSGSCSVALSPRRSRPGALW